MTKQEIIKILSDKKEEWQEKFGIRRMGIFGSFSRNEETEESDLDVYVEFDIAKIDLKGYMSFIEELESLLGRKADVITKAGKETIRIPYIKESIDRDLTYV